MTQLNNKKKVLMLLIHSYEHDSRVRREAVSLVEAGFYVTLISVEDSQFERNVEGVRVVSVVPFTHNVAINFLTRIFTRLKMLIRALKEEADIIHAHDINVLSVGVVLKIVKKSKLIYDSHELHIDREGIYGLPFVKPFIKLCEAWCIRYVDAVITVSDSIADFLSSRYAIKKIAVVRNCPRLFNCTHRGYFRETIGGNKRIVLFQGRIEKERGAELIVQAAERLPKYDFILMGRLVEPNAAWIRGLCREKNLTNIHILPSVAHEELLSCTQSANIGVVPAVMPKKILSVYFSLPNKLFEYIMAEIPVVVSDLPEMRKIVDRYNVGLVFQHDDPKEFVACIDKILYDHAFYERCVANARIAKRELNWEIEQNKLLALYDDVLK